MLAESPIWRFFFFMIRLFYRQEMLRPPTPIGMGELLPCEISVLPGLRPQNLGQRRTSGGGALARSEVQLLLLSACLLPRQRDFFLKAWPSRFPAMQLTRVWFPKRVLLQFSCLFRNRSLSAFPKTVVLPLRGRVDWPKTIFRNWQFVGFRAGR